jgi:hypothetical protein
MKEFSDEATFTSGLLIFLSDRVQKSDNDDAWYSAVRELIKNKGEDKGMLLQLKSALERLHSKLNFKDGIRKAIKILTWSPVKQDVKDILALIERIKSVINFALSDDLFQLALAPKNDYKLQQRKLQSQLSGLSKGVAALQLHTQTVEEKELVRNIVDWVPAAKLQVYHSDISSKRLDGTGYWLLQRKNSSIGSMVRTNLFGVWAFQVPEKRY